MSKMLQLLNVGAEHTVFTALFFTFSYVLDTFHNKKLEENETEEKQS